jgi:hypothetical protein
MDKSFAIMRHAPIQHGRHLIAAGLHNIRGIHTPNADGEAKAVPVRVLIGTRKPWKDVARVLDRLGIDRTRIKTDGNSAVEVVLAASPDWWRANGWAPGISPTGQTEALIERWVDENLKYLRARFGDHLIANVVIHLDEANPHIHALICPCQFRVDGRERGVNKGRMAWRLSTEKMLPNPKTLKAFQTVYAEAMAPLGLVRGEDRPPGRTKHKPLRQWQAEQTELARAMGGEVVKQIGLTEEAKAEAARIKGEADDYARRVRGDADREALERREAMELAAQEAEVKRRKDDATNVARTAELRQKAAELAGMVSEVEAEKTALRRLRERLQDMLTKAERMLAPISTYAARYLAASPIARSAMGSKGAEAVRVASTDTVAELEVMRRFMSGRGAGK